jgi:hypothetical protein
MKVENLVARRVLARVRRSDSRDYMPVGRTLFFTKD